MIVCKIKGFVLLLCIQFSVTAAMSQMKTLWEIGRADNQTNDLALAPSGYAKFLEHDFGWEDKYYIIGYSKPEKDFPYVLPGPKDKWGGTAPTSGIRSHLLTILFTAGKIAPNSTYKFVADLAGYNQKLPPLVKVTINGTPNVIELDGNGSDSKLPDSTLKLEERLISISLRADALHEGSNEIKFTSLDGSWLVFDNVRLEGTADIGLTAPTTAYIREVKAANYETTLGAQKIQPLLVDIEHLNGKPTLQVKLDGVSILNEKLEIARYQFEAPMPSVKEPKTSKYEILIDGKIVQSGSVNRTSSRVATYADYVDTKLGTAHSRWMIAPGPWMPFGMVKVGPDNQNDGWQAGYDPTFESVGAFSHIHEWTMGGLGMLPVNGPLKIRVGDQRAPKGEGYRSAIDKATEEAPLGYYKVDLIDYGIEAELTATTRASFQRYTFPAGKPGRVMIDLQTPAEYHYETPEVTLRKVTDRRIEGYSKQVTKDVWNGIPNEYTVHFVIEFDQPIVKYGTWINDVIGDKDFANIKDAKDAGAFVEFDTDKTPVVQVRTGISYVSVAGASLNLETEITKPFNWSFDKVRANQTKTWDSLLSRVNIQSNDRREKLRFYSNMYRAIGSRNIFSDVDGKWVDAEENIQQLKNKGDVALGCDAFWNTFWNLNQFWNLVTPEWTSKWVRSQLAMYDATGWLAKGPAGMEYIPVMVAEHEVPLLVSAYQMGIRDYDANKAFAAIDKTISTPAAIVGKGQAGNPDFTAYMQYKYVPYDKGRFSNTLEFAYDDWTAAQFAKVLGKTSKYKEYSARSLWWKNAIDTVTGYARMRKSDGSWFPDFDPFKSGANEHYVEGNAWQLTFFVPQDVPGLARTIGNERFKERLAWGFKESEPWRFNAPNDAYWDYPVIQGNQQSMHFAFLFNWVKQPWLTQKWSRSIVDRYYGYELANAYLGDEDQGQMSAWFIMAALGLFQVDGGARVDPIYEIASPLYENVSIDLGGQYGRGKKFEIEAKNASRLNKYVQSATLNGKKLDAFWFPAKTLLAGGKLVLEMGPEPNYKWGIANPPSVAK